MIQSLEYNTHELSSCMSSSIRMGCSQCTVLRTANGQPFGVLKQTTSCYNSVKKAFQRNQSVENLRVQYRLQKGNSTCCTHAVSWHQRENRQINKQTDYCNPRVHVPSVKCIYYNGTTCMYTQLLQNRKKLVLISTNTLHGTHTMSCSTHTLYSYTSMYIQQEKIPIHRFQD